MIFVMSPSQDASPVAIVRAFVEAINSRELEKIAALIAEDHVFIDSLGNRLQGGERAKAAWRGYFGMVPDYRIVIEEAFADGATVALFGSAEGTYAPGGAMLPENRWLTYAAWRAKVRENLVQEWRVYADNEPIREKMRTK